MPFFMRLDDTCRSPCKWCPGHRELIWFNIEILCHLPSYSLNIHPTWSIFKEILNITTLFPKGLERPHNPWFAFKALHILKLLHPANRVSYFPDFSERLKKILLAGLSFHCRVLQYFNDFPILEPYKNWFIFLKVLEVKLTPQNTKVFCLKCLEIWKLVTQNHDLHSLDRSSCTNRLCHCHF